MVPSPRRQPDDWQDDDSFWFRPSDLPPRPARLPGGIHGHGRLAAARDVAHLVPGPGALSLPQCTLLVEASDDGATLKPLLHHGFHLPVDLRERHTLAIGTTGCGKTQKLILPQLAADVADAGRAIIALDAKGGVLPGYLQALARRHRPGQPLHLVNLKSHSRTTHAWNPVQGITSRHQALEIAHAVCSNAESGLARGHSHNDAFWLFSSVNLLADVLRMIADDPKESASLPRAKQIIDDSAYSLAQAGDKHPFASQFGTRYPAVRRFIEGASNVTQQSVIADLAMRTTLFSDEEVACTTSGPNQLDVRRILREGGILVLEIPEAHAKQLVPLTNLFISRLFTAVLEESMASPDGRLPRPCSILLDELGSACGKLPDFETRLATLRSRGVSITGAVQSLAQLEHLYGPGAGVAEGFSTRLFFGGGLGLADAKHASELSGVCTVGSVSTTMVRDGSMKQRSRTTSPVPRAVLLPDEIARPPVHGLLGAPLTVFVPGTHPFLAYLAPAFEQPALASALAECAEIERARLESDAPAPSLDASMGPAAEGKPSLSQKLKSQYIYLVRGKDKGREAWYYVLVNKKPTVVFEKELAGGKVDLTSYGEVLLSGWGKDPPEEAARRAKEEWGYSG